MKIILGSSSPNRKELMDKLGVAYSIMEPDYEEIIIEDRGAIEQVEEFALGKGESVYEKVIAKPHGFPEQVRDENFLVLAFDSMISCEGRAIGKAKTKKEAFEQIQSFVGKPQEIITGVAVLGQVNGQKVSEVFHDVTPVLFRDDITNCQIRSFLEFGDWKGKCGSYSILGTGIFFLESINGDFQNIVGIPVLKMGKVIERLTGKSVFNVFRRDVS